MSYDLTVYVKRDVREEAIRDAVKHLGEQRGDADYPVVEGPSLEATSQLVLGDITVDGPLRLQPEDVPQEISKAVRGIGYAYHLSVPYDTGPRFVEDVERGRGLAGNLANLGDGVWVDEQTDEVWKRDRCLAIRPVDEGGRYDEVSFYWYVPRNLLQPAVIRTYVDLGNRYLPEALPRRYGDFQPFQHSYEAGAEELEETWSKARTELSFNASSPCIHGYFGPPDAALPIDDIWCAKLAARARALRSPVWRDRFRMLFLELAEQWRCIYASAEVTRGHKWRRGSSWGDSQTEAEIIPIRMGEWLGLPPYRMWWSYYAGAYAELVSGHLSEECLERTDRGLFYRLSDDPMNRDELSQRAKCPGWLPPELTLTVVGANAITRGTKVNASVRPSTLG